MSKTFEEQFKSSQFANDAEFLRCFERMRAENPQRHPSDLLFLAESIWRMQLRCVAAFPQMKSEGAREERARIKAILHHGATIGDLLGAVDFALQSELSAADAISILTARDASAPMKPN